jgi:CRP-like cAMP-binding protein
MTVHSLRQEIAADPSLERLLLRYAYAVMSSIGQSAACNRLHLLEQRCARWLLGCHDRAESDTFAITQDFLAMMLGVHRPGVSIAAQSLQSDGLITYNHGTMTLLDRKGLEARSCECYGAIRDEFRRLLSPAA